MYNNVVTPLVETFLLYNGSKSYLKKFQYKAPGNYSYYQGLQDAFPDEIQVYQKTDESKLWRNMRHPHRFLGVLNQLLLTWL